MYILFHMAVKHSSLFCLCVHCRKPSVVENHVLHFTCVVSQMCLRERENICYHFTTNLTSFLFVRLLLVLILLIPAELTCEQPHVCKAGISYCSIPPMMFTVVSCLHVYIPFSSSRRYLLNIVCRVSQPYSPE